MSPGNWVAIVMVVIFVCWLAGKFVSILLAPTNDEQARADAEELLQKDNEEVTDRPRVRAGTTQPHSLHRTHYEP